MDLSQKIIKNEREIESIREKSDILFSLETYDHEDKVMHFSDVVIDHLHYLLDMKTLAGSNTSLVIGGLMRELKKFAIETETTIFLVSHIAKTKAEVVPTISDLRDSSFVAQESDIVMIMWRHREKDRESPTGYTFTNESRLIVDKNRWNGKLGFLKMIFRDGRFTELTNTPEGLPEL